MFIFTNLRKKEKKKKTTTTSCQCVYGRRIKLQQPYFQPAPSCQPSVLALPALSHFLSGDVRLEWQDGGPEGTLQGAKTPLIRTPERSRGKKRARETENKLLENRRTDKRPPFSPSFANREETVMNAYPCVFLVIYHFNYLLFSFFLCVFFHGDATRALGIQKSRNFNFPSEYENDLSSLIWSRGEGGAGGN